MISLAFTRLIVCLMIVSCELETNTFNTNTLLFYDAQYSLIFTDMRDNVQQKHSISYQENNS